MLKKMKQITILQLFFREVTRYAKENEHAVENLDEHLSNPINVYVLVKRLTSDWKRLENLLKNDLLEGII